MRKNFVLKFIGNGIRNECKNEIWRRFNVDFNYRSLCTLSVQIEAWNVAFYYFARCHIKLKYFLTLSSSLTLTLRVVVMRKIFFVLIKIISHVWFIMTNVSSRNLCFYFTLLRVEGRLPCDIKLYSRVFPVSILSLFLSFQSTSFLCFMEMLQLTITKAMRKRVIIIMKPSRIISTIRIHWLLSSRLIF